MDKIYSRHRIKIIKGKGTHNKKIKKIYFMIIMYGITIATCYYVFRSINPIFEELCKSKALSIATDITNKKTSEILEKYNYKDVVQNEKFDGEENSILKTDVVLLNKITSDIAIEVQKEFDSLKDQNIEIPIGALTGNKYLIGFGPKINVKIISVEDIKTEIKTEFKSAGINQTLYRIYMDIQCNVSILTPYKTLKEDIINQILLVENVVVGGVPDTYLNMENQ